jgi:hypothetical protein
VALADDGVYGDIVTAFVEQRLSNLGGNGPLFDGPQIVSMADLRMTTE